MNSNSLAELPRNMGTVERTTVPLLLKYILEKVVAEGTGNKAQVEGYRIGGKTATSQKLPRSARKYIASFMAFAPANDPQVIAMIIVDEPQGVYYGGTVVGPLMKQLYENILPYVVK